MKRTFFALVLALAALLCFSPAAAALEMLPDEASPDSTVEMQAEEASVFPTPSPDLPDELAPADAPEEVPILPENPPIKISYTTPEEIGFVRETERELEALEEEEAALDILEEEESLLDLAASSTVSEEPASSASTPASAAAQPAQTPAQTPSTPALPQTGTSGWLTSVLLVLGSVFLSGGVLLYAVP